MWLPVAQRELIVASRKPRTFWLRLVAPAVGLLFFFFASSPNDPPAEQGKTIFASIAISLFLYSALAGLFFTAESITVERRDATLPLLQVTGMRELDLVLGKLLGNSLLGIFGFLAAAPLLALPLLLGGITAFDVFRVFIALLGTLFLSLSIAVAASSGAPSSTQAITPRVFRGAALILSY